MKNEYVVSLCPDVILCISAVESLLIFHKDPLTITLGIVSFANGNCCPNLLMILPKNNSIDCPLVWEQQYSPLLFLPDEATQFFLHEGVRQEKFVMEAVIILTFLAESELIDALAKQTLAEDKFWKNKQLHKIGLLWKQ